MIIVRCLFLMLFATCFYGSDTLATDFAAPLASHNFFTPELKPSPDSFKLAKSTWLPDSYDDLGLSGHDNTKYDFNKNDCSQYTLSSCPQNGKCTKCPVGAGWKLDSCNSGYTKTGDTCTKDAVFCETNSTTYKNKIPDDYFCAKVTNNPQCSNSSLTNCNKCYTSCYKINCSGYPLDCKTIDKTALHIAMTEICSNCKSSLSNCIKTYCKITTCADGYKINAAGTACVEKEDICPNGYYKSCETGTQGDPKYTEKGTACYQCKPKTEDKPQRECKLSPGNVCIYSDGDNNFCIGSECSEKEYPYEEEYMKPNCTIAPTYGEWCSKRSCSDDNPLCYELLDCSEHIAPQCPTLFAWNQATDTCSYHDEQGRPSSCKITGDYSTYECPTGQKCLFTLSDDGYYGGRCVDASITEADIQKAIVDATQSVCSLDNENADSKLAVFYLGSDNPPSELLSNLNSWKSWTGNSNLLTGPADSLWPDRAIACSQNSYNQCMIKKFNTDITLKSCEYPNVFDLKNRRMVNIACELKQSSYISTFCKMDYCAIVLEKINEYPLSNRTKEIFDTYILHELKSTVLWSDKDYYAADIYTIHADNKTVSLNLSGPNKKNILSLYLTGCGGCTRHIKAIEATDMSINGDYRISNRSSCFDIDDPFANSFGCSNKDTEYSFIYRMLYNPDTIANYNGTTTEARCQSSIKDGGNDCFLEKTYWHR